MARLPQPGGDEGDWGDILNEYLSQSHKPDGTIKDNAVGAAQLQDDAVAATHLTDGSVVAAKLDDTVKASLDKADTALQATDATTAATGDTIAKRTSTGAIKIANATADDEAVSLAQLKGLSLTIGTVSTAPTGSAEITGNAVDGWVLNIVFPSSDVAPTVTTHPSTSAVSVDGGMSVSFSSAASGDPAPTVQWQESVNGGSWNNTSAVTASATFFMYYDQDTQVRFRAVWTNRAGTAVSNASGTVTVISTWVP